MLTKLLEDILSVEGTLPLTDNTLLPTDKVIVHIGNNNSTLFSSNSNY